MKNNWRNYLPIYLPLIWMPLVIGAVLALLPNGFHPLSAWRPWALGGFQFFEGLILLGVVFSLWACWKLRGNAKYTAGLVYLLTLPMQIYAVFMVNVMMFGK